MKTLLTFIATVLVSIGGAYALLHTVPKTALFGDYNPAGAGTYRLQSSIGGTATSFTLASFTEPVSGIKYTMSYLNSSIEYGTLEPSNNSSKEFVSFTGITQNSDGSATITGVTRGLAFAYPYTASTTFQQAHPGQAIFILSNPPQLTNQYLNLINANTVAGVNTFSSTSPPRYDQPGAQAGGSYIATTSEFASIAYVNAVALVSAPNATTAVKGVAQLATGLQAASSTALGTTGASLALTSAIATDTPSTTASSSKIVISDLTGHIKQIWLDLTANWSFLSTVSIPASSASKFTLNSLAYAFPTTNTTGTSTALLNDGSGNLSWVGVNRLLDASTTLPTLAPGNSASTTLYSFQVPANTLGTRGALLAHVVWGDNSVANTDAMVIEFAYGNGTTTLSMLNGTAGTVDGYGYSDFLIKAAGATGSQSIVVTYTTQTTGFTASPKTVAFEGTKSISTDSTAAQFIRIVARTPSGGGSDTIVPVAVTLQALP